MTTTEKATDNTTDTHNTGDGTRTQEAASSLGGEVRGEVQEISASAAAEAPLGQREDYEKLRAERDGLFERLARLQAEFDNARKRETRERSDYRAFAVADAVEQFLPVLDNFKLALTSGGTAEQLRVGVELIAKQMDDVLRSLNVTPVETVGTQFDPRVHEALESVERSDVPDHQVIEEVRRGYRIKDRLLRPALVRIAVNSHQAEA